MAKFFISMSGEGRGHATRVRALVERMRDRHQMTLFAPGEAYEFLAQQYATSDEVRLVKIPGLKFHYVNGRLHLLKTIFEGFRFQARTLPGVVRMLADRITAEQPDVIISDFEPALPRAAKRCGKPFLSLTHQHFLVAYDLSWLPLKLRFFAWLIGLAVPLHYTGQKVTMISGFFTAPLRGKWNQRQTYALGPMIRPEIRQQAALVAEAAADAAKESNTNGKTIGRTSPFLLSYLRKQTPETVVEELAKSPWPIIVYGLGAREPVGPLTFQPIDPQTFVTHLSACSGVVSAAGNQLLGECMYLGKPVLALPETWHHEQFINACFLAKMGAGQMVPLEEFRLAQLQEFLARLDEYRTNIEQTCLGIDGTDRVVEILEQEAACADRLTSCPR